MSSSEVALSVRGLGKSYTIAQRARHHASLAHALRHKLAHPFQRPATNTFWALKDVSFDVHQGDVVGVIGRNGAGKSTLLKILSRITAPTTGEARLYGRVGSLLEVGTGFHPELTGRENIFLNGALLGMRRRDIARQFDAIVDFAGVEDFLDTPVKRYSSGMYVRLAFAVAAHLDSEILIVDEALAVGDVAFQRKCLNKMGEVAEKQGRTVLFVSHNVAAMRTLCTRGIVLSAGEVALIGDIEASIAEYLCEGNAIVAAGAECVWDERTRPDCDILRLIRARIENDRGELADVIDSRKGFEIVIEYEVKEPIKGLRIGFGLQNNEGVLMCGSNDPQAWPLPAREPGFYSSRCRFPGNVLNGGTYQVNFAGDYPPSTHVLFVTPYCLEFSIEDVQGHGHVNEKLPGLVRPDLHWDVQRADDQAVITPLASLSNVPKRTPAVASIPENGALAAGLPTEPTPETAPRDSAGATS